VLRKIGRAELPKRAVWNCETRERAYWRNRERRATRQATLPAARQLEYFAKHALQASTLGRLCHAFDHSLIMRPGSCSAVNLRLAWERTYQENPDRTRPCAVTKQKRAAEGSAPPPTEFGPKTHDQLVAFAAASMRGHTAGSTVQIPPPSHVPDSQMDDSRRRSAENDALRKVRVLGHDDEVLFAGVLPNCRVGHAFAEARRVADGEFRVQTGNVRQVFVKTGSPS